MQIQSINNTSFKSELDINSATAFVNMNDFQIADIARQNTQNKKQNKNKNATLNKVFCAIPIVDSLAAGILAQKFVPVNQVDEHTFEGYFKTADLSGRLAATTKRAGFWGALLIGGFGYIQAKEAACKSSPRLNEFNHKHYIMSFLGDCGVIYAGVLAGKAALNAFSNSIVKHAPNFTDNMLKKANSLSNFVNNNSINNKLLPTLERSVEHVNNHAPLAVGASKFALLYSFPILFGIGILKSVKDSRNEEKKVENNYQALKDFQFAVSKHLVNKLGVENDILSQKHPKKASYIEKALSCEKPISDDELADIKTEITKQEEKFKKTEEALTKDEDKTISENQKQQIDK